MLPSVRSLCATALTLLALSAWSCTLPATEVLVRIDTNIDPGVPLTITARVAYSAEGGADMTRSWSRGATGDDAGMDGGITFPASFAVVPGDGPRDARVYLTIEADAGGIPLRRSAVFRFVQGATGVVPIYLTTGCADPATGCRAGTLCTVQQVCEEQGQTCGNEGRCVPVETTPITDLDASFGDVGPAMQCGVYGQACCNVGPSCRGDLSCVSGRCQRCTDTAEACCDGANLRTDGTECAAASDACHHPSTCRAGVCTQVEAPDGTVCQDTTDPCKEPGVCRAGVCQSTTNRPDDTQCSTPVDTCQHPGLCRAGVCQPQLVADGTECQGTTNPCLMAGTCRAGVCQPTTVAPDGTQCGMAADACHTPSLCQAGLCVPQNAADGTQCAAAADACHAPSTCRAGACLQNLQADGTVCAAAPNNCHMTSVCTAGVCTARNVANGTVCASTTNPCQNSGTCTNGTCGAITNKANGTVCASTTNPCRNSGTCTSGACGAITNKANGTVCAAAANSCQNAGTCTSGNCGAVTNKADNTHWGASPWQVCCGGSQVTATSTSNCFVCGLRCASGQSCVHETTWNAYYCSCTTNLQCSNAGGTCRTSTPGADRCACSTAADCPSGHCLNISGGPNHCY